MNVTKTVSIPLDAVNELDRIAVVEKKKFPEVLGVILDLGIRDYKKKNGEIKSG
jgi:hypothetical protein